MGEKLLRVPDLFINILQQLRATLSVLRPMQHLIILYSSVNVKVLSIRTSDLFLFAVCTTTFAQLYV